MIVTKIARGKRKGFFDVYVDEKRAFTLSEEDIVKDKIKIGSVFSDEEFKKHSDQGSFSYYLARILNFLSFRARTRVEIERKLAEIFKKDDRHSENEKKEIKEQVMSKVQALGLVNDEYFAQTYTSVKSEAKKPLGKARIKLELYKKGVAKDVIEKALEYAQVSDAVLEELVLKKLKFIERPKREDLPKTRQRMCNFLLRRGFGPSQVFSVVDTIIKRKYNRADLEETRFKQKI